MLFLLFLLTFFLLRLSSFLFLTLVSLLCIRLLLPLLFPIPISLLPLCLRPMFRLPLSIVAFSPFFFLLLFILFFRLLLLRSLCSAVFSFLFRLPLPVLFLFIRLFFSSSCSLGFPPGSSFPHFLPLSLLVAGHPVFSSSSSSPLSSVPLPSSSSASLVLYVFFSPPSAFSSFPNSFFLLPLSFVCVSVLLRPLFLPQIPFSSSSSFSVSFRCFIFLFLFTVFFHSFPFVCECVLAVCGVGYRLSILLPFWLSSSAEFLLALPFSLPLSVRLPLDLPLLVSLPFLRSLSWERGFILL